MFSEKEQDIYNILAQFLHVNSSCDAMWKGSMRERLAWEHESMKVWKCERISMTLGWFEGNHLEVAEFSRTKIL